ncbi:hypothetical protein QAD02_000060 [Eretmocerus hayati]|uniref:Uncharacterized protein n=1 Tax=Eretmocerus hayati TaxID=131215 RepID=A0ACC2NDS9_9HYME|nr:hypothetical protein QAD02_000060 [Eretmocerus hayati]
MCLLVSKRLISRKVAKKWMNYIIFNSKTPEFRKFRDMAVVASEKVPELSRKDLMEIIHKSQYFQDIFTDQPDPMTIQFGHVCENPNEWEQRFEQRDFNKNHYQGKMRWGNKNGDYGEQYWDLGHAG